VLVVDDDAFSARLLSSVLERSGHDVVVAGDSSDAIRLCLRSEPDLVILDLHMPDPDGFELLRALPAETRGVPVPVVVVTADTSEATRRRALAAGAHDFINKPFDAEEVRLRVRNVLETRAIAAHLQHANDELEARVAHRTYELERTYREMLDRLALAAELRDDDTGEHTRRVARTSALVAHRVGLAGDELETITLAAPLHDVGKIAIPDGVLLKPGRLSREEFATVQTHTVVGGQILGGSNSHILQAAAEVALHHHERWDGGGYPEGLSGEAIPLAARIVAIADVFDALTHERPYKHAWSVEDAVTEIVDQAGARFDPQLVTDFAVLDHHELLAPVAIDGEEADGAPRRREDEP
jgi:putative two-component system response regulator